MEAPILGKLLRGHYRVLRTLAKGGFGETYIAEDIDLPGNPQCVVKHLRPASVDAGFLENARRLFLAEAETLQRLGSHDQIPRLFAYFEEDEEFYLVQELIEGHSLAEELRPGQCWAEAEVRQLLYDVLTLLHFIHQNGVIHRDIKPDNLIRRHRDHKPVLVDFGTVKQLRTSGLAPQGLGTSAATIVVGTPGYMPTEQGRGKPRANSDIYALGVIGIQAVTGLTLDQLQDDQETGEIIWRPWAQVSDEVAAILTQMTRYYFKERYPSAAAALQDLAPLVGQPPPADAKELQPPSSGLPQPPPIKATPIAASELPVAPPRQTVASPAPPAIAAAQETAPSAGEPAIAASAAEASTHASAAINALASVDASARTAISQRIQSRQQPRKPWIAAGIGLALISVLGATYALTRSPRQTNSVPAESPQLDRLEQDKAILAQARDLASAKTDAGFEQAIQTMRAIKPDSPVYKEAQKQALTWQATLLQTYLRSEVPKEKPKLAALIKQIRPSIAAIDADQITIRYDGSAHPDFRSDRGLRVLTALFMGRLRGNPKEDVPQKYTDFNQLVVFRQQGKQQASLRSSEWDAYVKSKAKEEEIYRKVKIAKR